MNRNINWPSRINLHQAAAEPPPRFLTSQIWMNELEKDLADIRASGVEIVEIHSTNSSSSQSPDKSEDDEKNTEYSNQIHPWSYASRLNTEESKLNRQARLRNSLVENGGLHNEFDDSFYFNNTCPTPDTADREAFTETCCNILDKLSALQLDSSLDDFESNEARDGDVEAKWNGNNDEFVYSSDLDDDKRTVWIYSIKNKHILSEDTNEVVNIPSRKSIESNHCCEIGEELNTTTSTRVSSPIPAMHIPRLDLSLGATLPNVTEVTEPKSLETLNRKHVPIRQTPANNWCVDNSGKKTKNKVSDIVNWMGLSPRERRPPQESTVPIKLQSVLEVPQNEDVQVCGLKTDFIEPVREDIELETATEIILKMSSQINSQRSSITSKRGMLADNATYLISPLAQREDHTYLENKADLSLKNSRTLSDRYVRPSEPMFQITKTTENLYRNNWVSQHEKGSEVRRVKSAGNRTVVKDIPLFKPKGWEPFSTVEGNIRPLQLELEMEENKTLLQSCVSCFKCCK